MIDNHYPTLRSGLDFQPVTQAGQPHFLLRDPLALSEQSLLVPQPLGAVLALCDGTVENAAALSAAAAIRYGLNISPPVVEALLAALDEACLLENQAYAQARRRALERYHAAPFRPPASAGHAYPADAAELRRLLEGYLQAAGPGRPAPGVCGLLSPHIDYDRGGAVYAQVWRQAARAAEQADLAVILGTNHFGDEGLLALTRQSYATPYGVLPTDLDVVDRLAEALGPEVFEGELFHGGEHSVELAAVWLHHMRGGRPCALLPVLCGSLERHVDSGAPEAATLLETFVNTLKAATAGRQVLVVAAGDLAHVGPAFSGAPQDAAARARLTAADQTLLRLMEQGEAAGFRGAIERESNRYNVCGAAPIYLALRLLEPVRGRRTGYMHCPADDAGTSVVSIGGIVFTPRPEPG